MAGPLNVRDGLLPRGVRLLLRLPLVDDVLGRLSDDAPAVVEPAAPGASRDLLELADGEEPHLRPVELRELREEDRPDRDVHADAQRVGAADDVEEPLLRELLDEEAVLRQEAGVVDPDPEREESPELLAVGGREAPLAHDLPDLLPLLLAPDLHARERLRQLRALPLREVHDVDGALLLREEVLDRLVERRLAVLVVERHGTLLGGDVRDLAPREGREALGDRARVSERRRHEEELRPAAGRGAAPARPRRAPCPRSSGTRPSRRRGPRAPPRAGAPCSTGPPPCSRRRPPPR